MKLLPTRDDKIQFVVDTIKQGEKPRSEWAMGIELEHFVVDANTKKRKFYYEEGGVRDLLTKLSELPQLIPVYSHQDILGLHNEEFDISIEPGAQFEISVSKMQDVGELYKKYREALEMIFPTLEEMNLELVTIGLDPVNKAEDIPIIPKKRYDIMNNHMSKKGTLAKSMMRQSCALQMAVDYCNEDDFIKKFQVLTAMTPILYTLFDNSAYLNGELVPHYNMRQEVWLNTDNDRSGILPTAFNKNFGYHSYAEWLLDIPVLFVPLQDGNVHEVGDKTLDQLLDSVKCTQEAHVLLNHALSIVFPDVRVKQYIEIRQMDEVPERYAFGAAALMKGLLYNPAALDSLKNYFKDATTDMVQRGKKSGHDNGIQGYYFSEYFANWGIKLIEVAKDGLSDSEQAMLRPLYELWNNLDTPRTVFERISKEKGLDAAIENYKVSTTPTINL